MDHDGTVVIFIAGGWAWCWQRTCEGWFPAALRHHSSIWGSLETGYPPSVSFSTISSTLTFLASKLTSTEKDKGLRLYFVNPSILPRIDLILSCESPHPPVGRLGTINFTVFSVPPEIPSFALESRKIPTSTKMMAMVLRFIKTPHSSADSLWLNYLCWSGVRENILYSSQKVNS